MNAQTTLLLTVIALLLVRGTPLLHAEEAFVPPPLPPAAGRQIDFDRDVRPILRENCLSCHGPEKQKGGYRVDLRTVALTGGEGFAPNILPGKSAESPLIQFVAGQVEDMLMPSKGDPLTEEQIGILRAWIDQGAVWPEDGRTDAQREAWDKHWAFQPMASPAVPLAADPRARGEIDAFLSQALAAKGLGFSPEADRRTLIRRATVDLTGLPPTPEDIEAFIADSAPDAYERLVERLLASPAYGERWGRHWLDVVRFAESDGFERNNLRTNAWPYRDYVIRSFNEDRPYPQFVMHQLAGDAVGVDAATGFLVGGPTDKLQSFEPPAFNWVQRGDELHDMVNVTSATFLGLTVACARCHDHKFDPISARDYYSLSAVLQGVEHGERPWRPENVAEIERAVAPLRRELAEIDAALAPYRPRPGEARTRIVGLFPAPALRPDPKEDPNKPTLVPLGPEVPFTPEENSAGVWPYAPGRERGQAFDPGHETRLPTFTPGFRRIRAVTAASPWDALPAGRFRLWISWAVSPEHAADVRYVIDLDGDAATTADQTEIARVDQRRFADGSEGSVASDGPRWSGFAPVGEHSWGPGTRLMVRAAGGTAPVSVDVLALEAEGPEGLPPLASHPRVRAPISIKANEERFEPTDAKFVRFTLLAANDGEGIVDEVDVFTAGPGPRNVALAEFGAVATAPTVKGSDGNPFYVNDGRFNEVFGWVATPGPTAAVQIELPRVERIDRIVWSRNRSDRIPRLKKNIPTDYRIDVSTDGQTWREVASARDRLPPEYRRRVATMQTLNGIPRERLAAIEELGARRRNVVVELARKADFPLVYAGRFREPGPSHRLHRGDPLSRREQVSPGGLERFGRRFSLPPDTPEQARRVALAEWITDPNHPLTARVMVNRIWHYHFGTGIVDTPSDFGMNGGRPSNPELLDWLAKEFIARGWRIKEMHRLIMRSHAYRQISAPRPAAQQIDAESRLLWRFPPQRLPAEAVRDTILAVSGAINLQRGGPGFDLFESYLTRSNVHMFPARTEFGPAQFRRMVYQTKPRMQLDDVFGAFDCPDAGQTAPKRNRSTTPLQAFNLLNSPFALQQASLFAARLAAESGPDPAAQVRRAFALAFGRAPEAAEIDRSVKVIQERGLAVFCRVLLNVNEFIYVN